MSRIIRPCTALGALLLLPVCWLPAQSDTFRLARALAIADSASPAIAAARLRADAAGERIAPAGTLPDPMVSLGLMNRRLDGFGADEMMTMNQVEISQRLPWFGTLGAATRAATAQAAVERIEVLEARAQLALRVSTSYVELAALDRTLRIEERTRDLLRAFLDVAMARYGAGDGLQQDVLQAQVGVAERNAQVVSLRQRRVGLAARLSALLGRAPGDPFPSLELPGPSTAPLPAPDALIAAAADRPALQAATARIEAARAGVELVRQENRPELLFSMAYGQRSMQGDMVTLMVGASVPIHAGSRAAPRVREMEAMQASAAAEAVDLRRDTEAQITELRASADEAGELARLYATSILPQARAAVESALSAYRVGRVDFQTLVQNELTVNRYETELVRLSAQYRLALAGIGALLGHAGGPR